MSASAVTADRASRAPAKRRWTQVGAAGGIAFVVLQLIAQALIQVGGSEPAFNAPAGEIVDFFMNRNMTLTQVGGFFNVLSIFAFLWFLGVLWATLRQHEGESAWLSLVVFASGLAAIAVLLSGGGWELALFRLSEVNRPEIIQLLFDQGNMAFASLWVALASMLLAAGIVTLRDGALPRWLGWFGLAVAGTLLVARTVWFTASGIKFMPYMLFWIWLVAASVVLVRRAGKEAG
jgi:hypothetical protein